MDYKFEKPLIEGLILKRKNRFIMEVLINDKLELCHCPCTGRVGNLVFKDIPALLSISDNIDRKTKYTVEAISFNNQKEKNKKWIGINQNKSNRYIEYFIKTNQLNKIIEYKGHFAREQNLGNSKLDFLIEDTFIEVKTPLVILPLKNYYLENKNIEFKETTKFNSFERFVKHLDELGESLKKHQRAILIMFYMFDAEKFVAPKKASGKSKMILDAVKRAKNKGVEMWQVNAEFNKNSINLIDYYIWNL